MRRYAALCRARGELDALASFLRVLFHALCCAWGSPQRKLVDSIFSSMAAICASDAHLAVALSHFAIVKIHQTNYAIEANRVPVHALFYALAKLSCYIPSLLSTSVPFVRSCVAENAEAMRALALLALASPNIMDPVCQMCTGILSESIHAFGSDRSFGTERATWAIRSLAIIIRESSQSPPGLARRCFETVKDLLSIHEKSFIEDVELVTASFKFFAALVHSNCIEWFPQVRSTFT